MRLARRQWGETPWFRGELPAPPARSATPDVAIIGGGLTGMSTAYHLARRGVRAVVFEAALVGDGASGRTGGLVLEGTAAGSLDQVDACVAGLERLVREEHIDCDLALPGCWEIEHRIVSKNRTLPWTDNGLPVSIGKTIAGGVVQPAALLAGIARAAIRAGAVVLEGTPAKRIALDQAPAVQLESETINPGHVVVATNAWINALLPDAPALSSSLTFACATEPLESSTLTAIGLGAGIPFFTADLPYLWGRTVADGRVIFGSGLVFGMPQELEDDDVAVGESGAALERLQQRVRGLHPKLSDIRFSAAWGGPIAFTKGAIPVLARHPRCPRVLVSGGYAGHGVALSVRCGELLADAITENRTLPRWGARG